MAYVRIYFTRFITEARSVTSSAPTATERESIITLVETMINHLKSLKEVLLDAALELDRRMKSTRQTGSVIGVERIAVMAVLNLAHEVISAPKVDDSQEE